MRKTCSCSVYFNFLLSLLSCCVFSLLQTSELSSEHLQKAEAQAKLAVVQTQLEQVEKSSERSQQQWSEAQQAWTVERSEKLASMEALQQQLNSKSSELQEKVCCDVPSAIWLRIGLSLMVIPKLFLYLIFSLVFIELCCFVFSFFVTLCSCWNCRL